MQDSQKAWGSLGGKGRRHGPAVWDGECRVKMITEMGLFHPSSFVQQAVHSCYFARRWTDPHGRFRAL